MALVPVVNMLFLCRVARRNAINWRWTLSAIVLLALLCADFWASGSIATNDRFIPDSKGNGTICFGLALAPSLNTVWWYLPRLALALGIGLLLIKRAQGLQKRDESQREISVFRQAA